MTPPHGGSFQEPRKVEEDEWYAAQARNDPSELRALVEQQVAFATATTGIRCFLRTNNTQEHAIVYMPDTEARAPGHTYSPLGVREAQISRTCEWCFDQMADDAASIDEAEEKGKS